jgi:hypothetical protein
MPAGKKHITKRPAYLLVENGLSLSTISRLLPVITSLSLSKQTILALLVLRNLVQGVFATVLPLAEGLLGLRNIHLQPNVQFQHNQHNPKIFAGQQ